MATSAGSGDGQHEPEDEFEDHYLLVALPDGDHADLRVEPGEQLSVLGLAGDRPLVQIGSRVFTGKYEEANGTFLYFDELEDPAAGHGARLRYFAKGFKRLNISRAFLQKTDGLKSTTDSANVSAKTEAIETDSRGAESSRGSGESRALVDDDRGTISRICDDEHMDTTDGTAANHADTTDTCDGNA